MLTVTRLGARESQNTSAPWLLLPLMFLDALLQTCVLLQTDMCHQQPMLWMPLNSRSWDSGTHMNQEQRPECNPAMLAGYLQESPFPGPHVLIRRGDGATGLVSPFQSLYFTRPGPQTLGKHSTLGQTFALLSR